MPLASSTSLMVRWFQKSNYKPTVREHPSEADRTRKGIPSLLIFFFLLAYLLKGFLPEGALFGLFTDGDAIDAFVEQYGEDITCISFMGGDNDPKGVNLLAQYIHEEHPQFKVAWYSGKTVTSVPLKKPTTNQRLYRQNAQGEFEDITSRFWKKP